MDTLPRSKELSSSTLYPKIFKVSDFVHNIEKSKSLDLSRRALPLTGTVKLHGTHADIVYASATSGDFSLQSRNQKALVPGITDNVGFAAYTAGIKREKILALRDKAVTRYQVLHPKAPIEGKIVLAGEWCGQGVQKGVGISQFPRFLAIVSVNINGRWVEDWEYTNICDEEARIFNISKAGYFHHALKLDNLETSEAKIKELVDAVEKECPFAKAFGISGVGEGIVWKANELCGDPTYWFKSKGDRFAVSNSTKLPPSAVDMENKERVANFAKAIVTESRLEQGLSEQKQGDDIRQFFNWMVNDCVTEERLEIEKLQISHKQLKTAIIKVAKPWYMERIRKEPPTDQVAKPSSSK